MLSWEADGRPLRPVTTQHLVHKRRQCCLSFEGDIPRVFEQAVEFIILNRDQPLGSVRMRSEAS
jgi:hypothetical protein